MVEGVDYTLDESGRFVLSASFLLKRGTCCSNGCRNCPFPVTGLEVVMDKKFSFGPSLYKIKVDLDELPRGYSGSINHKDENVCVSLCAGNCHNDNGKLTVLVDFEQFGFSVQGGASMWNAVKDLPKEEWYQRLLVYTFTWLGKHGDLSFCLDQVLQNSRAVGYHQGQQDTQAKMREALGLDG